MKALFGIIGTILRAVYSVFGFLFAKLSLCSLAGIIVGSFTGFMMTIIQLEQIPIPHQVASLLLIALMLGFTGFLLILLFLGLLLQYGVLQIFWLSLVNSLITAVLTVFVTITINLPVIYAITGLIIGIFVGAI